MQNAIRPRVQDVVSATSQDEPIQRFVQYAPHDILLYAIAAKSLELVAQIVAGSTRSHFRDQFGRSFDVVVLADADLPAELRLDEKDHIRLGLVGEIEPHRSIVACVDSR